MSFFLKCLDKNVRLILRKTAEGSFFEGVLFVFSLFPFQSVFLATKTGDIR